MKNAHCFGQRSEGKALSDSNVLEEGECVITGGSSAGDWRLPNYKELLSLIDAENFGPALPSGYPFTNVQPQELLVVYYFRQRQRFGLVRGYERW